MKVNNRIFFTSVIFICLVSSTSFAQSDSTTGLLSTGDRMDVDNPTTIYNPKDSQGKIYQLQEVDGEKPKYFILQDDHSMKPAGDTVTTITVDSSGNRTNIQGSETSPNMILVDEQGKTMRDIDPLKELNIKEQARNEPITVKQGSLEHSKAVSAKKPYKVLKGEFDAKNPDQQEYTEIYSPNDDVIDSHLVRPVESNSDIQNGDGYAGTQDASGYTTPDNSTEISTEESELWTIDVSEFDAPDDNTTALNSESSLDNFSDDIIGLDGFNVASADDSWEVGEIDEQQLQREISQFNREEERRIAFEKEQERLREIQHERERAIARAEREREREIARAERESKKGGGVLGGILQGMAIAGAAYGVKTGNTDLVNTSIRAGVLGATGDPELAESITGSVGSSSYSNSSGASNCSTSQQNTWANYVREANVCTGAQRYLGLMKQWSSSGICGVGQNEVQNAKQRCNGLCDSNCY